MKPHTEQGSMYEERGTCHSNLKSTQVNPSQLKSIQANPSQPRSTQVTPSQPLSMQVNPSQFKSTHVNPSHIRLTQVSTSQPKSTMCCFFHFSVPTSPQDDLIERLLSESVLDVLLALTEHVKGGGLRQQNLLFLEVYHHVFRGQKAEGLLESIEPEKV